MRRIFFYMILLHVVKNAPMDLHSAAEQGNIVSLKKLLDDGVDVNSRNKDGDTALMFAAYHKKKGCVKLLLARGADTECKNNAGYSVLRYAPYYAGTGILTLLLEHGADANAACESGHTALQGYASLNNIELVRELLAHNVTLDNQNTNGGDTALHYAAAGGHAEMVQLLLDHGACVHVTNQDGKTALDIALNADIRAQITEARTQRQNARAKKKDEDVHALLNGIVRRAYLAHVAGNKEPLRGLLSHANPLVVQRAEQLFNAKNLERIKNDLGLHASERALVTMDHRLSYDTDVRACK